MPLKSACGCNAGEKNEDGNNYEEQALFGQHLIDTFNQITTDPLLSSYFPSLFLEDLSFFPTLGDTSLPTVSNITIIPQVLLESQSTSDIINQLDRIRYETDASIHLSDGIFLIGTTSALIDYDLSHPSCLSGFIFFPIEELSEIRSFFCISETPSTARFETNDE